MKSFTPSYIQKKLEDNFEYVITADEVDESVKVLEGRFTSKDDEYQKFKTIEILKRNENQRINVMASYLACMQHMEFYTQINDIINVGMARYRDKYSSGKVAETPFVLYEKYSRRDD